MYVEIPPIGPWQRPRLYSFIAGFFSGAVATVLGLVIYIEIVLDGVYK